MFAWLLAGDFDPRDAALGIYLGTLLQCIAVNYTVSRTNTQV